jgi:hypothetical protein
MSQNPPKRIPLVVTTSNRDSSTDKDARLVNGYVEKGPDGKVHIYKRPGYVAHSAVAAGVGRGIFYWQGSIYSVCGGTLYKDTTSKGAVDSTAGSFYNFTSCLGSTPKLFLHNGIEAYYYDDTGGLVNVVDADYPTTTVGGTVYLDGTIYIMTSKGFINGSEIENPASWDPLNSILAQIEPDPGVALAKQMSYVIALKEWSTEVFYDAAEPTGSPLGRVEGAKANIGCRSARSVQDLDGTLIWVSQSRSGSCAVHAMTGLKVSDISTPPVARILQEASFTTVTSFNMAINGHRFYVLSLPTDAITLVYDLKEGLWYRWADSAGNDLPIVAAATSSTQQVVLQHESNGKLFSMDSETFSDDGATFIFDLYTPIFDGGTRFTKMVNMLEVIGDQVEGGILQVAFSDDDYVTWSDFRAFDMSLERPMEPEWGSFKRRAHHIQVRDELPLRLEAIDLHLDVGTL